MRYHFTVAVIAIQFATITHYVTAAHYQDEHLELYLERAKLAFRFATLIEQSCEVKIDLGQAYREALRETLTRLGLLGKEETQRTAIMTVLDAYDRSDQPEPPGGIGGGDE